MQDQTTLRNYLEALLEGDRQKARKVVEKTLQSGIPTTTVYLDLLWPIMARIEKLYRRERITPAQENLATRINRTIVDQLQNKLPRRQQKEKNIVVCCAPKEIHELGAQMVADLFESQGWQVRFLGAGLANDDILAYINNFAPDILLIYGTEPNQAPEIRRLINTIRNVNAWPEMDIMVSGGLFNRAEGLWEEIGADLFAETAAEAVRIASGEKPVHQKQGRTINQRKRNSSAKEQVPVEAASS